MSPQETIRRKHQGKALTGSDIESFVLGLVDGSWSDAQAAALAMAICTQGMTSAETAALTLAMANSGDTLHFSKLHLPGPVLDKHSTGGIGDKVSLLLAPIVAACGGFVPMVSGRGLGHTGGTLDKLASIPGYQCVTDAATMLHAVRTAGCAIVGASANIAPADARLYAIRNETQTIDSIPLITASILSKKLATGLDALVLDIKVGNGAFCEDTDTADLLAQSLLQVAQRNGLKAQAWLTDMDQVLGDSCGNAVEISECMRFLRGERQDPRLLEVTRQLSADLIVMGGLANDKTDALCQVDRALQDGRALEHCARMVHALGGPADFTDRYLTYLPKAPIQRPLKATSAGWIQSIQTRDIGNTLVRMGAGRIQASDAIDVRPGLTHLVSVGQAVAKGEILAMVHAADAASADYCEARLGAAICIGPTPPSARRPLVQRAGSASCINT